MNKQEKQIFTSDNLKETAIMTIAVGIIAAAVYFFLIPSMTSISSISALAIVMSHYIPLHVSTITMILNVVLLLIGFVTCGKEFGAKTVYTSILLPVYLAVFEHIFPDFTSLTNSSELDVICYILVVSIGLSILFNMNASSGGLDIVAKIMNKYLHIELGKAMSISGMCVALSSALIYDKKAVVLSVLGTYFNGIVLDHFIFGQNLKRRVCIITKYEEEVRQFILSVFRPDGYNTVVVIRHGRYMTVYANLGAISVSNGQKVKAGQAIGTVFTDTADANRSVLHFEIRNQRVKENPTAWLR